MAFCLDIRGEFACFTRPEMKVERVSYDVITPSAARSIFEAILWKPAISWQINKIEVLSPIRWINLRRNEVSGKISAHNAKKTMNDGKGQLAIYIEDERQQRASLFLRDVHYRLHAEFSLTDKAGCNDNSAKFAEMFRRRVRQGQCINQPYLGCREFTCDFELVEGNSTPSPINLNLDLGWMLYDMDYSHLNSPTPLFFRAKLIDGVLQVPARDSDEVKG